jgi:hypothetical protein
MRAQTRKLLTGVALGVAGTLAAVFGYRALPPGSAGRHRRRVAVEYPPARHERDRDCDDHRNWDENR